MNPFQAHGAFSWNELMTTNIGEAKEFYAQLFQWDFEDVPMEEGVYSVVLCQGVKIGGVMKFPSTQGEPSQCHWGPYITVDNVDQVAKQAEALGGKIVIEPRDIPNVGRFSLIQDCQGATLSIITYLVEDVS